MGFVTNPRCFILVQKVPILFLSTRSSFDPPDRMFADRSNQNQKWSTRTILASLSSGSEVAEPKSRKGFGITQNGNVDYHWSLGPVKVITMYCCSDTCFAAIGRSPSLNHGRLGIHLSGTFEPVAMGSDQRAGIPMWICSSMSEAIPLFVPLLLKTNATLIMIWLAANL